jgi:hypothetical protein
VVRLRHLGIDTYEEPVIYMSQDCPVCRSEGWEASSELTSDRAPPRECAWIFPLTVGHADTVMCPAVAQLSVLILKEG